MNCYETLLIAGYCHILVPDVILTENDREFVVKNGEMIEHALPLEFKYLFPDFTPMTIIEDTGDEYHGRVNVFLPDHTLRTVDDQGDTLLVADPELISRITSADKTIIPVDGKYVTVIAEYGDGETTLSELCTVKLKYEHISDDRNFNPADIFKTGSPVIIRSALMPTQRPAAKQSEVKMKCTYKTEYVLTQGDKIYPAELKSFQKVFPASKSAIKDYVRTYHTYFNDRESLQNLFNYCVRLQEIM